MTSAALAVRAVELAELFEHGGKQGCICCILDGGNKPAIAALAILVHQLLDADDGDELMKLLYDIM